MQLLLNPTLFIFKIELYDFLYTINDENRNKIKIKYFINKIYATSKYLIRIARRNTMPLITDWRIELSTGPN